MEDVFNYGAKGGLRHYDAIGAAEAVLSLSLGMCRTYYRQIYDDNISYELSQLAEGNESAMLEALSQRIRLLEKQGRSKSTFNVTREFEIAPVTVNFSGKKGSGRSTYLTGAKGVDVECVSGIASHAEKPIKGIELEQTKLARRVAALVKHKDGCNPAPQVTNMPKMLRGIDYSSKAISLARAVDGQLTGLIGEIIRDVPTAAQASQIVYSRAPPDVSEFVAEHQGFKYIGKKICVDIPAYATEQGNKKAIKEMLNVYPGQKSGPGNLAASHMDGIPLTGKMRTMLDHVQDFQYVKADVYFLTGSKAQVYTSIYKAIVKRRSEEEDDSPFLLTYVNSNSIPQRKLQQFVVTDERGDIKKILKSGIICGNIPPRAGVGLKTSFVDFGHPKRAAKDKISLEADSARKRLLDRVSSLKNYTYYQVYANYLSLSFKKEYKMDENYEINDAATWNSDELYTPSVLGRAGLFIYTGRDGGVDAMEMSRIMLNMIYHSILYVYIGQHSRQFGTIKFGNEISVDFSLEGTVRHVASVISGGLSAVGEVLGEKFRAMIDDKLDELNVNAAIEEKKRDQERQLEDQAQVDLAMQRSEEDLEQKRIEMEAEVARAKAEIEEYKRRKAELKEEVHELDEEGEEVYELINAKKAPDRPKRKPGIKVKIKKGRTKPVSVDDPDAAEMLFGQIG